MAVNKVVYNGNTLIDLTNDSVASDKMLSGTTAHDKAGNPVSGSIVNNGAMNKTMDGVNTKSVTVPAGYTSGGTVSMDSTVDNAVAEALTALTEKGVTVPEGTNVTGLADLIAAIEAGGGGAKIATGTFVVAEQKAIGAGGTYTFTHNGGFVPKLTVVFAENTNTVTHNDELACAVNFFIDDSFTAVMTRLNRKGIGTYTLSKTSPEKNGITEEYSIIFGYIVGDEYQTYLVPNKTYNWVVVG